MSDFTASKKLPILAGVFAVQVALAGLLFWQGQNSAGVSSEPVFALEGKTVDHFEVATKDESVNLHKKGGSWMLPEGVPADSDKVDTFMELVEGMRTSWPVAETASAQERFEVSDDNYQRRISLFSEDEKLGTVIMGSSPSFRQVHLRKEGEDEIYSVRFDIYRAPSNKDSWLDLTLMQPKGEISAVASGAFKIEKAEGAWPVNEVEEGDANASESELGEDSEALASAETEGDAEPEAEDAFNGEEFEKALTGIRVLGFAKNLAELDAPDASSDSDSEALTKFMLKVTTNEGEFEYEVMSKKQEYFVRRNDYEGVFRITKSTYEALAKIKSADQALALN